MSKFSKFKDILSIAGPMAKPFIPGGAGTLLDAVTQGLNSHSSPPSGASADAIKQLAADNDEQTQAILAIHERQNQLDARLTKAGF